MCNNCCIAIDQLLDIMQNSAMQKIRMTSASNMKAFCASTSNHIRCPFFLSVAEIHMANSLLFTMDVKLCMFSNEQYQFRGLDIIIHH